LRSLRVDTGRASAGDGSSAGYPEGYAVVAAAVDWSTPGSGANAPAPAAAGASDRAGRRSRQRWSAGSRQGNAADGMVRDWSPATHPHPPEPGHAGGRGRRLPAERRGRCRRAGRRRVPASSWHGRTRPAARRQTRGGSSAHRDHPARPGVKLERPQAARRPSGPSQPAGVGGRGRTSYGDAVGLGCRRLAVRPAGCPLVSEPAGVRSSGFFCSHQDLLEATPGGRGVW
jgi:hypothetical protein